MLPALLIRERERDVMDRRKSHIKMPYEGRTKVTSTLQEASKQGLTVARTWAFSDGGSRPLQASPGVYNEPMFEGLDFVVSEAKRNGIYLILCLVNNYPDFGGKKQYVLWARERGQNVSSDDDFYRNDLVKDYYKDHIKTILTRKNTITGVVYKDDPTIFAWELMNEPRCETDLSGETFQAWVSEMAAYVKSIDSNHLLDVGLEGFYGPQRKELNPNGNTFGTDFISNNQISNIDFSTIHAYPDQWLQDKDITAQVNFIRAWSQIHINDSARVLGKPLVLGEFGLSSKSVGYNIDKRNNIFSVAYSDIYESAKNGGPLCGGIFWQLLTAGMDNLKDGYEVIVGESPSTANIISFQSKRMAMLNRPV